ncbi:MAG: hypothetical protein JSW58_13870 [Candidatus Latescibacterota bacterium]|nr:MAG: hypothetical protein JSW58_13870 [Candidatus Latescibacterota bacterium]
MNSMRSVVLLVLAMMVAVSCSQLPRSTKSPEEMANLRSEYLQNHPDGTYNQHIMEGRVVKGMNTLEVLASWGLPNLRRSWKHDNSEYWTYYAKDEHTQRLVSYELVFEERVLHRWVVNTGVSPALGTAPVDPGTSRTITETLRLGTATTDPGSAGKKKK